MKRLSVRMRTEVVAGCSLLAALAVPALTSPALAWPATSSPALASPALAAPARARRPEVLRLRPGAVVAAGGLSAVVPPRGQTVFAEALTVGAPPRSLSVESRLDGRVVVHAGPARDELAQRAPSGPAGAGPSAGPSACDDSAYSLYSSKWTSTYKWYFKKSSAPDEVDPGNAEGAVKHAVGNVTGADNNCGLPDNVSAAYSYQGTTSSSANLSTSGSCGSGDGRNVADFGTLPDTMLALSCWWVSGGTTTQGDLRLNKAGFAWVVNIGEGCSNKYSVEAVSTHEFGHIFGLAHVSESSHPALTMSPSIAACQSSESTLGLGDVRGLEARY